MAKRVLDGDAIWSSDRIAALPEGMRIEYPWLYPLADCNGSFEITNLKVVHGKVSPNRPDLTEKRLADVFVKMYDEGLLFIWQSEQKPVAWNRKWNKKRKIFAHWTQSEKSGRLPPVSHRSKKYEKVLAPPVPIPLYKKYLRKHGHSASTSDGLGKHQQVVVQAPRKREQARARARSVNRVSAKAGARALAGDLPPDPPPPKEGKNPVADKKRDESTAALRARKRVAKETDLGLEQDVVVWMQATTEQANYGQGKGWIHTKGKEHQGPTPGMMRVIRQKESVIGPEIFRGWWLDYLESPKSDGHRFPYSVFLESFLDDKLQALTTEIAQERGAERAAGLQPLEAGLPPEVRK